MSLTKPIPKAVTDKFYKYISTEDWTKSGMLTQKTELNSKTVWKDETSRSWRLIVWKTLSILGTSKSKFFLQTKLEFSVIT